MKSLGKFLIIFIFISTFLYSKDIDFKIYSNKKEAYVGEPIIVTLRLKIKKSLEILDYRFYPPKFNDFWVRVLKDKTDQKYLIDRSKYLIKELKYVVYPQKSGVLKISPAIIQIAIPDNSKDLFGLVASKWISVKSNEIEIISKPLPKDVDLIGDFGIKISVDKMKAKVNEPINLKIEIFGEGNIENFDGIKLDILDATLFSDKPKKEIEFKNKKLKVKFIQKFSIVSDRDFTIPSIKIDYFDLKTKSIKTLKTKEIKIDILDEKTPILIEEKKIEKNGFDKKTFIFGVISGIIFSIFIILIYKLAKKRFKKIEFKDTQKELLNKILPYISKEKELELFAKELYENIYEGKKNRIDKKRVNKILEKLEKGNN